MTIGHGKSRAPGVGEPITARYLADLSRKVNALSNFSFAPPLSLVRTPAGWSVSLAGGSFTPRPRQLGKITGVQSGSLAKYSWKRQLPDSTEGYVDDPGDKGTTYNAIERHKSDKVWNDYITWFDYLGKDQNGEDVWVFSLPELFACNMSKDSGSDGNSTTKASWKYTPQNFVDSAAIGDTAQTPKKQRPSIGTVTNGDAKVGIVYFNTAGDLLVYDANEVKAWDTCA